MNLLRTLASVAAAGALLLATTLSHGDDGDLAFRPKAKACLSYAEKSCKVVTTKTNCHKVTECRPVSSGSPYLTCVSELECDERSRTVCSGSPPKGTKVKEVWQNVGIQASCTVAGTDRVFDSYDAARWEREEHPQKSHGDAIGAALGF